MPKSRPQTNISLFPFLAVLVCTMGALILLLLVTTRRIRSQQKTVPELAAVGEDLNAVDSPLDERLFDTTQSGPPAFQSPALQVDQSTPQVVLQEPESKVAIAETDEHQRQFDMTMGEIEELDRQIDDVRRQIAEAETQLAVSEFEASQQEDLGSRLRSLQERKADLESRQKEELQRLADLAEQLDEKSALTNDIENVLQQRESSLVSLRALVDASKQTESAGREKTILEFSNSSGTARNPVIIELDADRCTFQPEGVSFSLAELAACPRKDNPLLSGVYATHKSKQAQYSTASPYVLLLVRPNSSRGFHAVRTRLMTAGIHFGYELIGHGQNIDTGRPSRSAANDIKYAMLKTLRKYAQFAEYNAIASEMMNGSQPPAAQAVSPQPSQKPTRPDLRLLPNGGLAMGDESGAGDGRYFAGNQRLPGSPRQFEEIPSSRITNSPDAGNPWAESERAVAAQQESALLAVEEAEASPNAFPEASSLETFGNQQVTGAGADKADAAENPFLAAMLAAGAGSQTADDVEMSFADANGPADSPEEQLQKIDSILSDFDLKDQSVSQTPTDWPQTEIAHSDSESRPVGSANSMSEIAPSGPANFSPAMSDPAAGRPPVPGPAATQRSTAIEEFLAAAADQKDASEPETLKPEPDPYLLELLNAGPTQQRFLEGSFAPIVPDVPFDFGQSKASETNFLKSLKPAIETAPAVAEESETVGLMEITDFPAFVDKQSTRADVQLTDVLIRKSQSSPVLKPAAPPFADVVHGEANVDVVPTLVVVRIGRDAIQVGNEPAFQRNSDMEQLAEQTRKAVDDAAGVGTSLSMKVQPQIRYEIEPGAEAIQLELKRRLESWGVTTRSEAMGGPVKRLSEPAEPVQILPQRRGNEGLSL